ncbi:MAG TPA: hypothetical protein PKD64_05855 [Pirellulaceae bacterium]|nr:hypothetical protein [Pirellulaceae bacterium]HMO91704.1 hypothetical protein [Pirellulaceae bacterium]HMP68400.1 hypothetical protein [Pirellulaceae bacterium]
MNDPGTFAVASCFAGGSFGCGLLDLCPMYNGWLPILRAGGYRGNLARRRQCFFLGRSEDGFGTWKQN